MGEKEFKMGYYQAGDIKLHVVEAGPADGALLMFLHGFPECWYGWHKQIPFFAAEGYRTVIPDQRGYNLSDKPPLIKDYTVDKLTKDIVHLLQALNRNKIILVGHDWGGIVAWYMAMHYPYLVEKLVILNAPYPAVMLDTLKESTKQKAKSMYAGFFQLPWLPEWVIKVSDYHLLTWMMKRTARNNTFSQKDLAVYRYALKQPGSLSAMLHWYRAARYESQALEEKVPVQVPTLVLWGKEDQFMNAALAQQSIEFCSQGTLEYLPEATHWLHHEESDTVNQRILEFISR